VSTANSVWDLSQEHFLRYEAAGDARLLRIIMDDEAFNPREKLKTFSEYTGPFPVLRNVSPTQPYAGKAILIVLYISRLLILTLNNSDIAIKPLLWKSPKPSYRHNQKVPRNITKDNVLHDNARSHVASTIQDTLCSVFLEGVGPLAIPPTRAA
jgi:hypothetical protein